MINMQFMIDYLSALRMNNNREWGWHLEHPLKDEEVTDTEKFVAKAAELFRIMKPFNDYLNRALAGFQMPAR